MNTDSDTHPVRTLADLNKRRVIDALLDVDSCSRGELASWTHLAPSTISSITTELIESGMIRQVGKRGTPSAGRRAEIVARNPKAATAIVVHYTTDRCTIGVVDFGLSVVEEFDVELSELSTHTIGHDIARHLQKVIGRYGKSQRPVAVTLSLPNHPVPESVVAEAVRELIDIPVFALNNVGAMALYHNYLSPHGTRPTFALVYVGTGIGSALVINGRVFHGVNGNASDLGHVHIKDSSIVCRCGRTGCVETFASMSALARQIAESQNAEQQLGSEELVTYLEQRLRQNDDFVKDVLERASADLAKGIHNLAALLDPGRVLLVSRLNRLSATNPFYQERLRRHFYSDSEIPAVYSTTLDFGEYRPEAAVVGAGLFTFQQYYTNPYRSVDMHIRSTL